MPAFNQPVIHDGQADAMPCECERCRRYRFGLVLIMPPRLARAIAATMDEWDRDYLVEARAC